ncbi:MAG TPA: hypothetical protein VEX88_11695 [Glaciibacter sp.]|nr:hypothetical protein [Glaciibacter sp.]
MGTGGILAVDDSVGMGVDSEASSRDIPARYPAIRAKMAIAPPSTSNQRRRCHHGSAPAPLLIELWGRVIPADRSPGRRTNATPGVIDVKDLPYNGRAPRV